MSMLFAEVAIAVLLGIIFIIIAIYNVYFSFSAYKIKLNRFNDGENDIDTSYLIAY